MTGLYGSGDPTDLMVLGVRCLDACFGSERTVGFLLIHPGQSAADLLQC